MDRSQSGFSLLEVLVAFSITAVALGVLYQIYAKGSTAAILAGEYAEALSIAESKLAGAAVNSALSGFHFRARSQDKYDWEILAEDYGADYKVANSSWTYSPALVSVGVSWHSQGKLRRVHLQTLKPATRLDGTGE